jgi:hypothetical protein
MHVELLTRFVIESGFFATDADLKSKRPQSPFELSRFVAGAFQQRFGLSRMRLGRHDLQRSWATRLFRSITREMATGCQGFGSNG